MNEAQVSKTQAVKKADSYLVHSRGMVLRTGSKVIGTIPTVSFYSWMLGEVIDWTGELVDL